MAPRKPRVVDKNPQREKIKANNRKEPKGGKELWWKLQENQHVEVFALLDYLDQNQPYRSLLNRYFRAVFRNRPNLTASSASTAKRMGLPSDRLLLNASRAVVNTKKNRIAKNNGRTRFMTNGADYAMRERAFLMEKFCAGLDYQQDTHGAMKRMFTDTDVCGTGAVKVYDDEDRIVTEWTDIDELIVDEDACAGGKAWEMHQRVWIAREKALEEYADIFGEEAIMNAVSDDRNAASSGTVADRICLVESWKLPFGPDDEGLHVFSIKGVNEHGGASHAEEWKSDKFPFAFLRSEVTEGFYGEGSLERNNPLNLELQKLLRSAHLGMALGSVYSWHVHDDAEVVDSELNNDVGRIVRWSGTAPPQKEVSNSVPPEIWKQIDWLYQMHYRLEGISEQSASARKEPGITAAVAMREQSDMESDRMSLLAQDYEWARVCVNELQIEAARRISERNPKFNVKFPMDGDGYLEIKFSDVDMKRDQFLMAPYPSSSLPQTPTARAQWIEERIQSGLITPEIGRKLMQMPDIEAEMMLITAPERDIDKTLDHMMRAEPEADGLPVYLPPEPFQNLQLALDRATRKYLSLRLVKGVPPDRLELLQRYANDAYRMIEKQKSDEAQKQAALQAAAAPPPMSPPAMPQGPAVVPTGAPPM